ncbi:MULTISPECIES: hypothetical protein [Salinibaculum]|uniref:hypothetical protein n=1 Tax=Salinibaculum TaxID=2732368 RepID=UPI0030CF4FAB
MRFNPPLPLFTSSSMGSKEEIEVHRECRDCGENLGTDIEECPRCGGTPVVYEFSE